MKRAKFFIVALFLCSAAFAQKLPKIAVYVTGSASEVQKKAFGARMHAALVGSWRYGGVERPAEFTEAVEARRAAQGDTTSAESYAYAVGKEFGADFVCVADITAIPDGEYQIAAHIANAKTAQVIAVGDFYGRIEAPDVLQQVSDELLNAMFASIPPPVPSAEQPAAPVSPPAPAAAPTASAMPPDAASAPQAEALSEASPANAPAAAVSVTGEAKILVDKVTTAEKAVKDAMAESMSAASAVQAAIQQKNFGAISQAKKKVQSAAEAVKKAKEDGTAAVEAVKTAGPEAMEAINALGIDLSLFAGGSKKEAKVKKKIVRKPMTGFLIGAGGDFDEKYNERNTYNYYDINNYHSKSTYFQFGIVHTRPIIDTGAVAFNAEVNMWIGKSQNDLVDFFGLNVPATLLLQLGVFSFEGGAHADLVFGGGTALFNAGFVAGAGIAFNRKQSRGIFYRYSSGYLYGTHATGFRFLF